MCTLLIGYTGLQGSLRKAPWWLNRSACFSDSLTHLCSVYVGVYVLIDYTDLKQSLFGTKRHLDD